MEVAFNSIHLSKRLRRSSDIIMLNIPPPDADAPIPVGGQKGRLAADYLVSPFTVLNANAGKWSSR